MQNPVGISSDDEILIFVTPKFLVKTNRVTRRTPATWAHFSTVVRSTLRLQVSRFYCDKDKIRGDPGILRKVRIPYTPIVLF